LGGASRAGPADRGCARQAKGNTTQVAAIKAYREKIEAELAGSA
jgi:hypothetical protein